MDGLGDKFLASGPVTKSPTNLFLAGTIQLGERAEGRLAAWEWRRRLRRRTRQRGPVGSAENATWASRLPVGDGASPLLLRPRN